MEINIQNSVYSKISKGLATIATPYLEFEKEYWKQGQYSKIRCPYKKNMIYKGEVLTGLIPRIIGLLNDKQIPFKLTGYSERLNPTIKPEVFYDFLINKFGDGVGIDEIKKFQKLQLPLIYKAIEKQRGVILSPTGSGKTVIAAGFISCFPHAKVLFLCHSLSIVKQTFDEFIKFGFNSISYIGGDKKDLLDTDIVISTIQSFVKINVDNYCDRFDITIIDESHHANNIEKSQYGIVMTNNLSPIKLGFTATLPKSREKLLSMEGLIGPVIGELTIGEAIEKKILVKPLIKLIPVPYVMHDIKKYVDIYDKMVVNSNSRNRLIIKEAKDRVKDGKTCLIMVKEIEHGNNLKIMADKLNVESIFIQGVTPLEQRDEVKKALFDKYIKCVIVTAIWREGVNIPSLDCIINACGGKSEIMTLQAIGRGLRIYKGKRNVEIVDFLDPYRYLSEHCISRLQIYANNKWI